VHGLNSQIRHLAISEQAMAVEENSAAHKLLKVANLLCAPRVAPPLPPQDGQQGGKHEAAGDGKAGGVGAGDDGAGPGWKVDAEGSGVYNSVLVNW
jgi:hypothetical protein